MDRIVAADVRRRIALVARSSSLRRRLRVPNNCPACAAVRALHHGKMTFLRALIFAALLSTPARSGSAEQESQSNTAPAFSESTVIEAWGWIVAKQENVAAIEVSAPERASFLRGFNAGVRGQPSPVDLWKASPDLERLGKARREKRVRVVEQHNESVAREFFNRLATHVVALPGGVRWEILKEGKGPFPKPRQ